MTHFLSYTDFDQKEQEITHSSEDLDIARKEGFAEGYERGLDAARKDIQAACQRILPVIETHLSRTSDIFEKSQSAVLDTVRAITKTCLPYTYAKHVQEEMQTMVQNTLTKLYGQNTVKILCAPRIQSALSEHITGGTSHTSMTVEVVGDVHMSDGHVKVVWESGWMESDFEEILEKVTTMIEHTRENLPLLNEGFGSDTSLMEGARHG